MRLLRLCLFCLPLVLLARPVFAGYISIVCEAQALLVLAERKVNVNFTLRNEGDENAKEVGLSFPSVNRGKILAQDLAPKAAANGEVTFTFDELKIEREGGYLLPYHAVYRDANYYAFSSPQLLPFALGEMPARALTGRYTGLNDDGVTLELGDPASITLHLGNAAHAPVKVEHVSALAPIELQAQLDAVLLPVDLAASSELALTLRLRNTTALLGSDYANWLIVQGMTGDRHFAEAFNFRARITAGALGARSLMRWLIIGLGVVLALAAAAAYARSSRAKGKS